MEDYWRGKKDENSCENDHRAASDEMGFLFLIAIFTRNVLRLEFKNSSLLSSIYQVRKLIVNFALLLVNVGTYGFF